MYKMSDTGTTMYQKACCCCSVVDKCCMSAVVVIAARNAREGTPLIAGVVGSAAEE